MAIITQSNYSAAGTDFVYADADSDIFDREHISKLAKAVADHTHADTRGLAVQRVASGLTYDAPTLSGIATHTGILKEARGSNVASGGSIALADNGNFFLVTGTTTINTITAKTAGTEVTLWFQAASCTVGHNTGNIKLANNANYISAINSILTLRSDGATWYEVSRSGGNGSLVTGTYVGNGVNPRTIGLAATPKLVLVNRPSNQHTWLTMNTSSSIYMDPSAPVGADADTHIVSGGFQVSSATRDSNDNGADYSYIAFI